MNRLVEQFLFEFHEPFLQPRFNIAPSQPIAALRQTDLAPRTLSMLRWGLVPSWAKDKLIGYKLINARGETVDQKPSFRTAFKRRRCLILSDGYFEWKKTASSTKKQPYYICLRDEQPFAFAGLWETWQAADGEPLETCTIITTEANELTKNIHHRMPVILEPNDYQLWLDPQSTEPTELKDRLRPYESERMMIYPVSTVVNNPRNETAECIAPIPDAGQQKQLDLL